MINLSFVHIYLMSFLRCTMSHARGFVRYLWIVSKASWQSSFHFLGSYFLRNLKMGSHLLVGWAINQLMYYSFPRNPRTSFSILSGGISKMDLIFVRSTFIPLLLTMCPNSFPGTMCLNLIEKPNLPNLRNFT